MPSIRTQILQGLALALFGATHSLTTEAAPIDIVPVQDPAHSPVAFNRDIVPILSTNCFACHGPDAPARKAGLRLDREEQAKSPLPSGATAIVPTNPEASALMERILSVDGEKQMPPPESGKSLSSQDREKLGQWIREGASWEDHWAFIPPQPVSLPEVGNPSWPRNPIDQFVLARLESEGIAPAPEADRYTLIRRLSLDLTGLPPSPDEVMAFVNDPAPNAYETVVERLLASSRYGEHWARYWLDLARYADTNGYAADIERTMWRYRDWVIDAFNNNMPFDQFTIEQLAGDLLPEPTLDQRIATGFNRNHPIMMEGGAIFEEYRVGNVLDRVHTTATTWLGLSMNCAQCHDHKYDPISQKEYFQFYAYFNQVSEHESRLFGTERDGNSEPRIPAPLPAQVAEATRLHNARTAVLAEMRQPLEAVDEKQRAWEQEARTRERAQWHTLKGLNVETSADDTPSVNPLNFHGTSPVPRMTALRLAISGTDTVEGGGHFLLREIALYVSTPTGEKAVPLTHATSTIPGSTKLIDADAATPWVEMPQETEVFAVFSVEEAVEISEGATLRVVFSDENLNAPLTRLQVSLSQDTAHLPASLGPWYVNGPHIAASGDESVQTDYVDPHHIDLSATDDAGKPQWTLPANGLPDGRAHPLEGKSCATYLYRIITAPTPRAMDLALDNRNGVRLWVNERLFLDKAAQRGEVGAHPAPVTIPLRAGENRILVKVVDYYDFNSPTFYFSRTGEERGEYTPQTTAALLREDSERTEDERNLVRTHYRSRHWEGWSPLWETEQDILWAQGVLEKEIPTTMVMEELSEARPTHVLIRGQYDQPGDAVSPGVPAALGGPAGEAPKTRLDLANWIVAPENPLTARVAVNRVWQRFFGTGLVATSDDFGVQGARPSHPELLDWLARNFVESGWDMKALQREIALSSTYRQHARHRPELAERDPHNTLLARGPRYRLDAEQLRDAALSASGLLVEQQGGPSVRPYQPEGLWRDVAYGGGGQRYTAQEYIQQHDRNLYRRSLYTFWKRAAAPPTMLLFDAPNREICTTQRGRSNTPLQALVLMNDTQYVEAARALAARVMEEGGSDTDSRIAHACLLVLSRPPRVAEQETLRGLFDAQWAAYHQAPERAQEVLKKGESAYNQALDSAELAAWTMVASALLNTDAAVSKF